ncbi:class II aldolase/adducin family protein [Sciscionella marina]|uniref:class II aldolase/adducin family protein n=1 Tax=Sciscionella marina TaxID=508770 RepID=UPI00037960B7|nr:class II aldolase/adducin family protein [Sciscionella marina]
MDTSEHIVAVCLRMLEERLVIGTSGNVSVREGERIHITPTGVDYRSLKPEDIPVVDPQGVQLQGKLAPTSELPLHLAVYAARPDASAIVHTHALHATAVSTLCETVPAIHYMLATSGTPVRVAEYATYGTDELARNAVRALEGSSSVLLRNHGTLSLAGDLESAVGKASTLEWCAQLWLTAKAAGEPNLLEDKEMTAVAEKIRGYGQPKEAL